MIEPETAVCWGRPVAYYNGALWWVHGKKSMTRNMRLFILFSSTFSCSIEASITAKMEPCGVVSVLWLVAVKPKVSAITTAQDTVGGCMILPGERLPSLSRWIGSTRQSLTNYTMFQIQSIQLHNKYSPHHKCPSHGSVALPNSLEQRP